MKDLARFVHKWEFAEFHGITRNSLGLAMLYYIIPFSTKAKHCVCIGSGAGTVPFLMRKGQEDSKILGSTVTLIDAMNGVNGSAEVTNRTVNNPDSEFNQSCSVNFIHKRSELAVVDIEFKIDYLHIDGDHSYEGVKLDWELYSPKVKDGGFITIHDTDEEVLTKYDWYEKENRWNGGPARLVKEIEGYSKLNFFDGISTGVTLLTKY